MRVPQGTFDAKEIHTKGDKVYCLFLDLMRKSFDMPKFFTIIGVLVLFSLIACNTSAPNPEDVIEVRKVLAKRAEVIKNKDIEGYRQLFMPDYFDGKYRLEDLVADMQGAFDKHQQVSIIQQRAPVETKMHSARVVQRVIYDLKGNDKPVESREILLLRKIDGSWKISGGVYVGLD